MSWQSQRGTATVPAARQFAHTDDAKQRVDEATRVHAARTRSWAPLVVGAALVVLVGSGTAVAMTRGSEEPAPPATAGSNPTPSDKPGDEPSDKPSDKPRPSPTPSQAAAPISATQPLGRYTLRMRFLVVRPAGADFEKIPASGWTFRQRACTATACSGTVRSDAGARYTYIWDGARLTLARAPEPRTINCESGGSRASRHTYVFTNVTVTPDPAGGPPPRILAIYDETVTYLQENGCTPPPNTVTFVRPRISLVREG